MNKGAVDCFIKETVDVDGLSGQLFQSFKAGEVTERYLREQAQLLKSEQGFAGYRKAINKALSRIERSRAKK